MYSQNIPVIYYQQNVNLIMMQFDYSTLFKSLVNNSNHKKHFLPPLEGSSRAVFIDSIYRSMTRSMLIITQNNQETFILQNQIEQLSGYSVDVFTDWETLPYDHFSANQDIISNRLTILNKALHSTEKKIIIVSVTTLLLKLPPVTYINQYSLMIKREQVLPLESFVKKLVQNGYSRVEQVNEHGQFAKRGSLLDIYPMGSELPIRIDFFDDEIDSIKLFDIDTQLSTNEVASIELLPAYEFPTDKNGIEIFRTKWREKFTSSKATESIYNKVSNKIIPDGIEYWFPLFFYETANFFDYISQNTLILNFAYNTKDIPNFLKETETRFINMNVDIHRPLLEPKQLWLKEDQLHQKLTNYEQYIIGNNDKFKSWDLLTQLPNISINNKQKNPLHNFEIFQRKFEGRIIFTAESSGRKEVLLQFLSQIKIYPKSYDTLLECVNSSEKFTITVNLLEDGFILDKNIFALVCENDLLGQRITHSNNKKNKNKSVKSNPHTIIKNLAELKLNQLIVHHDHGIGCFKGLKTIETNNMISEFMTIHYQNDAVLYVPVGSLNLISRYTGGSEENTKLSKLGTEQWAITKQKVKEKVHDVAAELLDVYSLRELSKGFAFNLNKDLYRSFSEMFPFEETEDQLNAINDVIRDMTSPKAMDRLVCGDVGFGKTEVAMRASFLCVENAKQVIILVPTTLLAQQHFENFRDRFSAFPFKIEMLSRFKTVKEQKQVLTELESGQIDILIGTHKLINTKIDYHDLGLLIIDEEHRFGVKQKEKIKAFRNSIDILTMTATPIPRTLNMAMHSIRELSIIATPPAKRMPIKTFVTEHNSSTIKEAIEREILRGGQVFFLHNDVKTIEKFSEDLQSLFPKIKVSFAHGQMREKQLEDVMNNFYHQRFQVLVCTTIIETGIDIPSANTIIIDRADKLGLAQLHQIKGRVGRSSHQAYAYLLTPPKKLITKDAQKRLEAISSLEDLGAGFMLATHDLEIRGAGELLGEEQSGQIQSVGYSMYIDMLNDAVKNLKSGCSKESLNLINYRATDVELGISALIPEDYIPDINIRLSIYKRLSSCDTPEEIGKIHVELIDRFGLLPSYVKNFIEIQKIKTISSSLGIKKIQLNNNSGKIEFTKQPNISHESMIQLLQKFPKRYSLRGPDTLIITHENNQPEKRIEFVNEFIKQIK